MPVNTDEDSHLVQLFFFHVKEFSGNQAHRTSSIQHDRLQLALFGHHNLAVFGILIHGSLVEKVAEGLFPQGVLVAAFLAALFGRLQNGSIHKGIIVTAKVAPGTDSNSIPSGVSGRRPWPAILASKNKLCCSTKKASGDVNVVSNVVVAFHGAEKSLAGSVLVGLDGGLVEVHLVATVDFVGRENQGLLKDGHFFGSGLRVFVSAHDDLTVVLLVNISGLLGEVGQDGLGGDGGWGHGGGEEGGEGDGGVVHGDEVAEVVEGGRRWYLSERLLAWMDFEIVRVSGPIEESKRLEAGAQRRRGYSFLVLYLLYEYKYLYQAAEDAIRSYLYCR
jgi:hypothetical protein